MGTWKSGWLEQQGPGIFWKDWKKRHCVLYHDGEFSTYLKTVDASADNRIQMNSDVKRIDVGFDCGGNINLPKGRSDVDALFAIVTKHKTHIFLAPSISECREWIGVLENARKSVGPPKKVPIAPIQENYIAPPPYTPIEYSQPLRADVQGNGGQISTPAQGHVQSTSGQPVYGQPMYGIPMHGQPVYGQPAYGQPVYGQPMYGHPVYVNQVPQQQQGNNNTRNMLLAGGGGLLGGYLLGSMISENMHHHYHSDGGFGGDNFGDGGFDF